MRLGVVLLRVAAEILHERSSDKSVEALGELFVDNAIPDYANTPLLCSTAIYFLILSAII